MRLAIGTEITARAILFDMDGTLVDSTAVVERIWSRACNRWNVDFGSFRHRLHGRRAVDIMRDLVPPGLDPEVEVRTVDTDELNETVGIVPIPGAERLIAALPRGCWALVTSARPELAVVRMRAAGLPVPDVVVSSREVANGKPHPEGFLLAAARIGVPPAQALVFEDAVAGLAAGHAAGCRVIALATSSPDSSLDGEDWLPDLSAIRFTAIDADGTLKLSVVK